MMRLIPIIPLLLSIAALILAFLCMFAGSNTTFLTQYPLLTLNVSRIGQDILASDSSSSNNDSDSESSGDSSFWSSLTDEVGDAIDSIQDTAQDAADNVLNRVTGSLADRIGLDDFYTIHVMGYCRGMYEPGPVPNATNRNPSRNVTACPSTDSMFAFNLTRVFEEQWEDSRILSVLGETASSLLRKLGITESVEEGIDGLEDSFKALFVIYCVAIVFTGLTLFACVLWVFRAGKLGPLVLTTVATFAWLFMMVASVIATIVSEKGADAINKGRRAGLAASEGTGFLAMTWAAFACVFIASCFGCVGFCTERRRRKVNKTYSEKP